MLSLLASTGSGAVNAIHVLEPASLPTQPVSTRAMLTIMLAAVLGAGAGDRRGLCA